MIIEFENPAKSAGPTSGNWSAVYALTLCISVLVASEFMPVSLLTPIANDLHLTEGQTGQAITMSGIFAVFTSLTVASITQHIDRRTLFLWLTMMMLVSGLVTTFAPNFTVLLVGRAMVGVVIGGFWSMSAATAMRLVPEADVPRALAVFNGGNALAATVAAPLGSLLGTYIGWRGTFFCIVPLAAVALIWQFITLPSMRIAALVRLGAPFAVLRRPHVPSGIVAVTLFFMGQFALFTYLRPFLETVTQVSGGALSLILLVLGVAGLLGTYLIGFFVKDQLSATLFVVPMIMAAIALTLIAYGHWPVAAGVLLAFWGLLGTAAPVAWWTWLARTVPDEAEAAGGLMVAVVQLAITAGAAGGGLLFDAAGYQPTFAASAVLLGLSAIVARLGVRTTRDRTRPSFGSKELHHASA